MLQCRSPAVHVPMQLAMLQCVCGRGKGGCVCTHCGTPGVCDPRVVQRTQQTTTVGVLCSCSFRLSVCVCV